MEDILGVDFKEASELLAAHFEAHFNARLVRVRPIRVMNDEGRRFTKPCHAGFDLDSTRRSEECCACLNCPTYCLLLASFVQYVGLDLAACSSLKPCTGPLVTRRFIPKATAPSRTKVSRLPLPKP